MGSNTQVIPADNTKFFTYTQTTKCSTSRSAQSDIVKIYGDSDMTFIYDDGVKKLDYSSSTPKTWGFISSDPVDCPLECSLMNPDDGRPLAVLPSVSPLLSFKNNELVIDTKGDYNSADLKKDGIEVSF